MTHVSDSTAPTISSGALDSNTGRLILTASEFLDHSTIDLSKLWVPDTNGFNLAVRATAARVVCL